MTKRYQKSILQCLFSIKKDAVHGADVAVSSLSYDSREIRPGAAFFALPGVHTDGLKFVDAAIEKGAVAVIHEKTLPLYREHICYIQVSDVRAAMAAAAAAFFDDPSKELVVIGVTGTEGKTSTVDFIWQLLRLSGKKAGFSSTVSYSFGEEPIANPAHQTTPESVTVQERLAHIRDNGCEYAVLESSSHGLSPRTGRLLHVDFDVGIFMNVTQEHLEFHGTFEQYRFDKANLFRALDASAGNKKCTVPMPFGVVNAQDPSAPYFMQATDCPVFGFSVARQNAPLGESAAADASLPAGSVPDAVRSCVNYAGGLFADSVAEHDNGLTFTVHTLTGQPFEALIPLLRELTPVKGRMCRVQEGQDFEIIIDYAHTPSSFELILPPIRDRIKARGGNVIAVFGSGGERDTVKRPQQGRIAAAYCDCIILADEDPRGEDPYALLEMIAAGCPEKKRGSELMIIPDRPAAIRKAFSRARKNDAVLLLGKGHENSIIGKDGAVPYDEYAEAQRAVRELFGEKSAVR